MWRTVVAAGLVLTLAACSSGDDDGGRAASSAASSTTTTTLFQAAGPDEFSRDLDPLLEGEDEAYRTAAYDYAISLCDLLDNSTTKAEGEKAKGNTPEENAEVAKALSGAALDLASGVASSEAGLDPEVTKAILGVAVDDLCPRHASIVDAYLTQSG